MPYYATKNQITKEISVYQVDEYERLGWTISHSADTPHNPYIYSEVTENRLEPIEINGEQFVGYSSFYCINTKTYVQEPERTLDGSIPNIEDYETFLVPRVKISFSYMTIDDFRRFLRAITPNEFNVKYYDYEIDQIVTHKMYIEPREMAEIYNRGFEILATTGLEISLIGTLNDTNYLTTTYYDNVKYSDISSGGENAYIPFFTKDKLTYGMYDSILNGKNYNHHKTSSDTNTYTFKYWTTNADGTGSKYYSNETYRAVGNLVLYAQWDVVQEE